MPKYVEGSFAVLEEQSPDGFDGVETVVYNVTNWRTVPEGGRPTANPKVVFLTKVSVAETGPGTRRRSPNRNRLSRTECYQTVGRRDQTTVRAMSLTPRSRSWKQPMVRRLPSKRSNHSYRRTACRGWRWENKGARHIHDAAPASSCYGGYRCLERIFPIAVKAVLPVEEQVRQRTTLTVERLWMPRKMLA